MIKDIKVGKSYYAKFKNMSSVDSELYNAFLPIKVLERFRYFWLVEVTPHKNPIRSQGKSVPYRLTILPHQLKTGEVYIKEM